MATNKGICGAVKGMDIYLLLPCATIKILMVTQRQHLFPAILCATEVQVLLSIDIEKSVLAVSFFQLITAPICFSSNGNAILFYQPISFVTSLFNNMCIITGFMLTICNTSRCHSDKL